MDARLTHWQIGNRMLALLPDYAGENGADAFWSAKDELATLALVWNATAAKQA